MKVYTLTGHYIDRRETFKNREDAEKLLAEWLKEDEQEQGSANRNDYYIVEEDQGDTFDIVAEYLNKHKDEFNKVLLDLKAKHAGNEEQIELDLIGYLMTEYPELSMDEENELIWQLLNA